jgi:hypothetical protein
MEIRRQVRRPGDERGYPRTGGGDFGGGDMGGGGGGDF